MNRATQSEKTNRDRNFLRHAIVFGIGTVLIPVVGLVLLPLYTTYLAPDEMGILEIVNRIAEVLGICAMSVGIQHATQAFYLQAESSRERDSLAATMLFLFLATLMLVSIFFVPILYAGRSFLGVENPRAWIAGIGSYLLLVSLEIPFTLMKARLESVRYVVSSVFLFVFRIFATVFAVAALRQGVWGVWGATAAAGACFAAVLYFREIRRGIFRVDFSQLGKIVRFSLPLVPGGIMVFLLFNADRFFLVWFWDNAQVGIYSTGYKIGSAAAMCAATPFLRVWAVYQFDWLSREDGAEIFARWFTKLIWMHCAAGLGLSLFSSELLRMIATQSYQGAAMIVGPIVLADLFLNASYMLEGVFYVFRRTVLKLCTNVLATFSALLLYFLLIPMGGGIGAAVATVLSYAILFVFTWGFARTVFPVRFQWFRGIAFVLLAITAYLLCSRDGPFSGMLVKGAVFLVWAGLTFPWSNLWDRRTLFHGKSG